MRLSEYKGEEAIEVLAEMLEPVVEIVGDNDVREAMNGNKLKLAALILKTHKHEVLQILAASERESVEEYSKKVNPFTLPMKLLEIINDPDVQLLFQSQS